MITPRNFIRAIAACALALAAAGCFMSEKRLFDGRGSALFGKGVVTIEARTNDEEPEIDALMWTERGYVDPNEPDNQTALTFHHLPGTLPWSPWYVGQTDMSDEDGAAFSYELYRKDGARLLAYEASCTDLTDEEAELTHMQRSESGRQCNVETRADLAKAFRILAKRKLPETILTATPGAPPPPATEAPPDENRA